MEKLSVLFALSLLSCLSSAAQSSCEANINGYKIQNVYVMGDHYSAVAWAYKHLSEWTCLTPVLDPAKADAVLELYNESANTAPQSGDSLSVSCSSTANTSTCTDSDGNLMTTTCTASGCSSYYGPDPVQAVARALFAWVSNASYEGEARIYTPDHKLLWRSTDQKGATLWYDKVRLGTNSAGCDGRNWSVTKDAHKYKTYRNWATEKCGINMAPFVSIDLKTQTKRAAADSKEAERQEMLQNAKDAAAIKQTQ